MRGKGKAAWLVWMTVWTGLAIGDALPSRTIPKPLEGHPGNIFLAGQNVSVPWPDPSPVALHAFVVRDDLGREIRRGEVQGREPDAGWNSRLKLGMLPVGWYRIEFECERGEVKAWTTAAVLEPLRAPTPPDSPVCLDAAVAWFAREDPDLQEAFANLAALAGVNWVRDRIRWRELQPEAGALTGELTTYDTAASIQSRQGLRVLQVFHDTPTWAHENRPARGRFTEDLRHVHRFSRELAKRFQGTVEAWEPWNEANVPMFGGHTVDQMCSWQKAAWLGFKSVDPKLIVGWNAAAGVPTWQHTEGVLANETWPYFDTYNIHTYDWSHSYADLWAPAREAASGRPLWITEADRGTMHLGEGPWYDQDPGLERLKAEWIAQAYASSLFAGATRHFHFILGHYHEPQGVQFGLLRLDLTPRPAYVALAAVGRSLAGAKVLGHWEPAPNTHVFGFRAQPDGQPHDVLVIFAERDVDWEGRGRMTSDWRLPEGLVVREVVDHLGRSLRGELPSPLTSAPLFVWLASGDASQLPLRQPPQRAERRGGQPSPVVLQMVVSESRVVSVEDLPWSEGHLYRMAMGEKVELRIHAYNFGETKAAGRLEVVSQPPGWRMEILDPAVEIVPGARHELRAVLEIDGSAEVLDGWVRLRA